MKIVVVNHDEIEMNKFSKGLQGAVPLCQLTKFTDPFLAVKYIWNNSIDIVFLEAEMRPANGTELIKAIRKAEPHVPIIILANDNFMLNEAERNAADGYWVRPITTHMLNSVKDIQYKTEGNND